MKKIIQTLILLLLMSALASCVQIKGNKDLNKSSYNGLNVIDKMENPEPVLPPEQEPPSYEEYKRMRMEMINAAKDKKNKAQTPDTQ